MEDDPSTPLVTVEGETIFTVQDLSYLMIEQEVSHEVKGTSLKTEKEVFEEAAEQRILAYIAEKLGAAEDRSFWEEEFDSHMEEIQDTDIYAEEKELSDTLQERLGMDDEAYKDWTVEKNVDAASAENLIDEITNDYQTILDPVELEENTRKNLEALAEMCMTPAFSIPAYPRKSAPSSMSFKRRQTSWRHHFAICNALFLIWTAPST